MEKYSLKTRLIAAAAVGLTLVLAVPILIGLVEAGVSLIVLGVIGMILVGMFQAIPYFGQVLENRLLSARKNEARKNPIEQLENFFMEKRQQVNQFKQAVSQILAQIKNLEGMIEERKKTKPGYDPTKNMQSVEAMRNAYNVLVDKYRKAEEALDELQSKIDEEKFNYKFAQVGQSAINSLNATSGEDVMNQILAGEAFDSIKENFHKVFADLEFEAATLNNAQKLTYSEGMYLDVSNIKLPAFAEGSK